MLVMVYQGHEHSQKSLLVLHVIGNGKTRNILYKF